MSLHAALVRAGVVEMSDTATAAATNQLEDAVEVSPGVLPTLVAAVHGDAESRALAAAIAAYYRAPAARGEGFAVIGVRDAPAGMAAGDVFVAERRTLVRAAGSLIAPPPDGCYLWCDDDASIADSTSDLTSDAGADDACATRLGGSPGRI